MNSGALVILEADKAWPDYARQVLPRTDETPHIIPDVDVIAGVLPTCDGQEIQAPMHLHILHSDRAPAKYHFALTEARRGGRDNVATPRKSEALITARACILCVPYCFYAIACIMQTRFGLAMTGEIGHVRDRLCEVFDRLRDAVGLPPMNQFVKSFIRSRPLDPVSLVASSDLVHRYPHWIDLAKAPPATIDRPIFDATFANSKAKELGPALRLIAVERPDFSLEFLRDWRVTDVLAWLQRIPGVGRKIAAATLNFSALDMLAFVVDTHVLRVPMRYGFVGPKVAASTAHDAVMLATAGWSGADLAELPSLLKLLRQTAYGARERHCSRCPLQARCKMATSPLWQKAPHRLSSPDRAGHPSFDPS